MNLQNSTEPNKRLLGIDLFRGVAAYGVVLIHGLGEIPRDGNALVITNSFLVFCVPFFLLTSFYFSYRSILEKHPKIYLKNRIQRIIFPYFAWTIIYLLARLIGWLIGNKESFNRLICDPTNVILFGASGVQLYFMPMLFFGILAAIPITKTLKNVKNNLWLFLYFLLSIFLDNLMVQTGNDFVLGDGIAFKQLIDISSLSNTWLFQFMRLILVVLAWTIKCIPYIIFSIILNNPQSQKILHNYIYAGRETNSRLLLILFLIPLSSVTIFIYNIQAFSLFIPYISLVYAILISGLISKNAAISLISKKLGYFSFGIYLAHALITAGFMPVMVKLYPKVLSFQLSPLVLIMSSAVIFFVSLAMTHFISLNKTAAKILLAI